MSNATAPAINSTLSRDIRNLADVVSTLPTESQSQLKPLDGKIAATHNRRHRLNKLIQEALTQLRLDIKYLEFDLQATRTERDEYKEDLERFEDFE